LSKAQNKLRISGALQRKRQQSLSISDDVNLHLVNEQTLGFLLAAVKYQVDLRRELHRCNQ